MIVLRKTGCSAPTSLSRKHCNCFPTSHVDVFILQAPKSTSQYKLMFFRLGINVTLNEITCIFLLNYMVNIWPRIIFLLTELVHPALVPHNSQKKWRQTYVTFIIYIYTYILSIYIPLVALLHVRNFWLYQLGTLFGSSGYHFILFLFFFQPTYK